MTFTVKVSKQAQEDIKGIFEYIAFELQSVEVAIRQLQRLEDSIKKLNHMPERFRAYLKEPWYSRGLRVMPVDNYIVFYIPDNGTRTVNVIRVMYGGRDIDTQLNKYT